MGALRDDGNEKRTTLDLASDGCIPGIATAQLTLVEPDFDAPGA
jgi:hypothetical protein